MGITGADDAQRNLGSLPDKIRKAIFKVFNLSSVDMKNYLKGRLAGGTTATNLAVRSNRLRESVAVIQAHEEGDKIKAGVSIGTVYARVHIGPKGQETTIRPKKGKFLAIPLEAAKTPAGVPRGGPRSGLWANTFVLKSKKGNLIIMGRKVTISRGQGRETRYGTRRTWKIGSNLLPLFVLKGQVKIPARIDPRDVLGQVSPKITGRLITAFLQALK